MNKNFESWFGDSDEAKRLYAQESLITNTSEDFLEVMESLKVKKSELAKLIGKSKSFVTQSLNGTRNLTLRTLADMAYALGGKVIIKFEFEEAQNIVANVTDKPILELIAVPNNIVRLDIHKPKMYINYQTENTDYKEAI